MKLLITTYNTYTKDVGETLGVSGTQGPLRYGPGESGHLGLAKMGYSAKPCFTELVFRLKIVGSTGEIAEMLFLLWLRAVDALGW